MNTEEAILHLRRDPRSAGLMRDSYLGWDVGESAERFRSSAEFCEVERLLEGRVAGGCILDLGAGTGIASYAFARSGARVVHALEPDPSAEIGGGAIRRLTRGLPVKVVDGIAEKIPLPDEEVDIVYGRQVLHHIGDLKKALRECARVLKPGGLFLACREHVVKDERERQVFLQNHPVHRLAGGENAYTLAEYVGSIEAAGLRTEAVLGPWDSIINAYPTVRTFAQMGQLERWCSRHALRAKFGTIGVLLGWLPGVQKAVWNRVKRPRPGQLYSFVARK